MSGTSFMVLDAAVSTGREEWLRRWMASAAREPMVNPHYVTLFARTDDLVVCLAHGGEASGVLYPLVLRPLAAEPWTEDGEKRWDAVTPYGYGGPFAWGMSEPQTEEFWAAAEIWFKQQGVVDSFARLSLFPEEQLEFRGEVAENMPNVVRSLDLDPEALWRDYAHKVRKNVNAARRAGLTFELDHAGRRFEEFISIYESTMDRCNAVEGFYFPREFFQSMIAKMPGCCMFAHVLDGDHVVSTELVLRSASRLYSFLGGTLAESFEKRPNDLLKHEVIAWGIREGYKAYVLGGGYGGPDGIFRYKLSFAPKGEVQFRVGRAVHDFDAYKALIYRRKQYEEKSGNVWSPQQGFFPAYRA